MGDVAYMLLSTDPYRSSTRHLIRRGQKMVIGDQDRPRSLEVGSIRGQGAKDRSQDPILPIGLALHLQTRD